MKKNNKNVENTFEYYRKNKLNVLKNDPDNIKRQDINKQIEDLENASKDDMIAVYVNDKINNAIRDVNKYTESEIKEVVDKLNDKLSLVKDTINILITANHNLENYVKALNYISHFYLDDLYSSKLQQEVYDKLIADVVPGVTYQTKGLNKIDKLKVDYKDDEKNVKYVATSNWDIINPCSYSTVDLVGKATSNISQALDDTLIQALDDKLSKFFNKNKKPKHKHEEYVMAVIEDPYKFDKETVYFVYEYLKDAVKKDREISKYSE